MNKTEYLNERINNKNIPYDGPKYLYKYKPLDINTFDMLENKYLYLCKASKLNDKNECDVTINVNQLVEPETNALKRECVEQIFSFVEPYMSKENYESARSILFSIMNKNGTVRPNFMLDYSLELNNLVDNNEIIAPIVNWIIDFPKRIDEPEYKDIFEKLFSTALNAKDCFGICSLSERNDIDEMWEKYAGDYSGCCIEYDVSEYDLNKCILPVVYQNKRETNVVSTMIGTFIGQLIEILTQGLIKVDKSHYLRLFLTKNKDLWDYEREWRLIGNADEKVKSPRISTIYVGRNISQDNYILLEKYCKTKGIVLVKAGE